MTHPLSAGAHTISIDGLQQHFSVFGTGPYCIAHSGGPGIDSAYLRMPLLERHLTMVYLEPIGTGESGRLSTHPFGYSVARFSQQLRDFIEATGIPAPFLLGHSHGGFVALDCALHQSARIAGVILYDSAAYTGGGFMEAAGIEIDAFAARFAGTPEADSVRQAWRSIPSMRSDEDYTAALRGLLPAYFSDYRRMGPEVARMREALRATLLIGDEKPFDVRETLPRIDCPVLILVGADDFILGPRHAAVIADLLPHAELVRFQHSGHFAHIEEPEAFASAVRRFTATPDDNRP